MKQLTCPHIGTRPISEFAFGGDVLVEPDREICDDQTWASHVFHRDGAPGIKREWWYHGPSGLWFILERDTLKDEVVGIQLKERADHAL